jgi:transposase
MVSMPKPYPKEFREGALALVRDGRPAAQVARELGIADSCIRNWIKRDQLDRRERDDGVTSAEREELRELRRRVRRLEQEKDILRKAAAFFARESEIG